MPDPNKEPQRLHSEKKVLQQRQPQSKDYKFIGSQRKYSREYMAGFTRNGDSDETRGTGKFRRKMSSSGTFNGKVYKAGGRRGFPGRSESYRGGV